VLNRRARRAASASSPRPPRCAAKLANHASPRDSSTTSRRAQTARSGSQGSASASIPDAVATASPTSLRGDGKSTFAHTPSPRPSPAPSRSDIRCANHRSIPRVGTATTSGAKGSRNDSASSARSAATSPSARSALWMWSTSHSPRIGRRHSISDQYQAFGGRCRRLQARESVAYQAPKFRCRSRIELERDTPDPWELANPAAHTC
jgi:hypothetical protein